MRVPPRFHCWTQVLRRQARSNRGGALPGVWSGARADGRAERRHRGRGAAVSPGERGAAGEARGRARSEAQPLECLGPREEQRLLSGARHAAGARTVRGPRLFSLGMNEYTPFTVLSATPKPGKVGVAYPHSCDAVRGASEPTPPLSAPRRHVRSSMWSYQRPLALVRRVDPHLTFFFVLVC